MLLDILLDTVIDSLKLLPFLFAAYLAIEFIEDRAEEKTVALVHRAGRWGPVFGGVLGVIPQCGFSAAMSNLYAGGIITRGTLLAVFLSTSDEMLPILISSSAPLSLILKLLGIKAIIGVVYGVIVDTVLTKIGQWLKVNGKAIYSTVNAKHYNDGKVWFTADKNGKTIYAIYAIEDGETTPQTVTWTVNKPKGSVKLLQTGKSVKCSVKGDQVTVNVPAGTRQEPLVFQFNIK